MLLLNNQQLSELKKPAEETQKPAEQKPAEEVAKPSSKPAENNNTQNETQKPAEQKPAEEAKSLSEFEQRVVELTNAERTKQGLSALQIDTELSKVARIKSEDMQKTTTLIITALHTGLRLT